MKRLPVIAVTMGDPAGIGPEIVVKAAAWHDVSAFCTLVVVGDAVQLARAAAQVGITRQVVGIDDPRKAASFPGSLAVVDVGAVPAGLPIGELSPVAGEAAYQYISAAVQLATEGKVDALCTAPLNKEALNAAGHHFSGHTELLAALTSTPEVSMMLIAPPLRVIHVTTHIGLLDAVARIEPGLVYRTIRRGHDALVSASIPHPRIGVCGLNPHAGEHGLFGRGEEARQIVPAVEQAQGTGIDVAGPLPADTLFFRAARGDFDLVVAMFHDQGHGPVKVLGLKAGVNVTVGLPFPRTSVDHGTAFDIAGTGTADEDSLVEALRQAALLALRPSGE